MSRWNGTAHVPVHKRAKIVKLPNWTIRQARAQQRLRLGGVRLPSEDAGHARRGSWTTVPRARMYATKGAVKLGLLVKEMALTRISHRKQKLSLCFAFPSSGLSGMNGPHFIVGVAPQRWFGQSPKVTSITVSIFFQTTTNNTATKATSSPGCLNKTFHCQTRSWAKPTIERGALGWHARFNGEIHRNCTTNCGSHSRPLFAHRLQPRVIRR